ncbi:MAG: hypothetical protein Q8O88_04390, partial [bacterium]|nr:hypothetical protein [bacterium]
MALVELSGHTNPTQLLDVAKPLHTAVASRQEVEHSTFESEWSIIYKGYDPKEEQAWRRRFTLGNGIITVVPRVIDYGSTPITKIRGLFEQKPPSQDDLQSPVPGGLNIPDFCHFEISIGETELQIDTSTLVRKFDIKYQKLTTEFDAADGQGRRVAVAVDEFASLSKPHKYVRRITIVPQYSGEISLSMGVNGDVPNNGHGYYKSHEAKALEDCFGVAYDAKTKYRNHEIAIAQRADVYSDDQETVSDTTIKAGDKSIYHKITLPVKAGKTCTIINVTSVHSTADSEKWEGIDLNLAAESRRETAVAEDYSVLLSEHIAVCEKRWNAIKIQIDGDEDVMRALRFNLGHSMAEAPEGYAYAGVGAKIGNNPFEAYGDRHFWDADIYLRHGLTPEQVKTLVIDYRHNLLPAAQKKAEKYFAKASQTQKLNWPFKRKGAFWPWESTVPTNNGEDGEGCPEWIINSLGIKAPIESLEEEIHISADIALAVTEYYWMTGNEELMRTKGAEMILEAARFYASRAVYNQKQDRYEYHHVTGPDEYHPGVDNNAYTNYLAKWTINEAIKLIRGNMVDDTVLIKTGLTAEEVWEWEKRAEKMYIP